MSEERSAAEAFGLLSDPTRVDILRAVAEAQNETIRSGFEEGDTGALVAELPFSAVYERVDVDGTSKLSYHLGELVGTFLRKSEGGYSLTHAGEQLARFVLAGNVGDPPDFGPIETAGCCLFCGEETLEARLHDQFFVVWCPACDSPVTGYVATPAQIRSNDGEDLVESLARKQAADYALARGGVCPTCAGRVDAEVVSVDATELPFAGDPLLAVDECRACRRIYSSLIVYAAAYHPASVAFHWERGLDVTASGMWEFHRHVREGRWTAERVGSDSEEYLVELRWDADALRLSLDADARVTRTERVSARSFDGTE